MDASISARQRCLIWALNIPYCNLDIPADVRSFVFLKARMWSSVLMYVRGDMLGFVRTGHLRAFRRRRPASDVPGGG